MLEACAAKPPQPLSGVARFSGDVGPFLSSFEAWLSKMLNQHRPGGIIFESPILPAETNPATVMKLNSLAGITQMVAFRRGIRWVRSAQPSTVKKHFSGSGKKGKQNVMDACRARGWVYEDDNMADALALWDFAATLFHGEKARAA
jgi:Holliday junction resolvasome RuvABC endonuclease subunit